MEYDRAGSCSGNIVDLYSGGIRFGSQSEHLLLCMRFSVIFQSFKENDGMVSVNLYLTIQKHNISKSKGNVFNEKQQWRRIGKCNIAPRSHRFTPMEYAPVPTGCKARWAQEPVWPLWRREKSLSPANGPLKFTVVSFLWLSCPALENYKASDFI